MSVIPSFVETNLYLRPPIFLSGWATAGKATERLNPFCNRMKKFFFTFLIVLITSLFLLDAASFAQVKLSESAKPDAPPVGYHLRQGDKLSIKFLYHPELNETTVTVRPDGFINLQLIDDVAAAGLTVSELKTRLEKKYDETLINPVISVALLEFVAPRIFIGGQIGKPGRYDLRDGQTMVEVIFLAGGFTENSDRRNVLRARPDSTGNWQIESADVLKILNRKKGERDLSLQDGDYIYVPDSKLSRLNKAVETFRGLLPRIF